MSDISTITSARLEPRPSQQLRLPAFQRFQLECWAAQGYPHETCGVLLGHADDGGTRVVQVRRARNLDVERAHERFTLDPSDHLAAENEARELGLDVVGIWHSHPDSPASPSDADRAGAWGGWSYVIVAIDVHAQREVRSWRLGGDGFQEEVLCT